jgi:hypothetical protein
MTTGIMEEVFQSFNEVFGSDGRKKLKGLQEQVDLKIAIEELALEVSEAEENEFKSVVIDLTAAKTILNKLEGNND